MINIYYPVFAILMILFACKKQHKVSQVETPLQFDNTEIIDQTLYQQETTNTPLYQFAAYMDSMGFVYDLTRMKKTYAVRDLSSSTVINKYSFFNFTVEQSSLFLYFLDHNLPDTEFENAIDISQFKNVQSISAYFFTQREAELTQRDKFYIDGYMEEWSFADTTAATNAASNLALHSCYVYFNTCAFICCIENKMYVISSRSSGFMFALRPYAKWFFDRYDADVYADFHIY